MVRKSALYASTIPLDDFAATKPVPTNDVNETPIPSGAWSAAAEKHILAMEELLYPPSLSSESSPSNVSMKRRKHLVAQHPIYNFLHTYYRYSTQDLLYYSPGLDVEMETSELSDPQGAGRYLNRKYLLNNEIHGTSRYSASALPAAAEGRFGWISLSRTRDVLLSSSQKQAFYGCYGLHEWAMLYSGNAPRSNSIGEGDQSQQLPRHQQQLQLRVSQNTIDKMVHSGYLRCTHFDAFRFFHPNAQPLNVINPLTRDNQVNYEQPGCVHANMDLFKYAFRLYPFVSSLLLRQTMAVALQARIIDMRASPYDVSAFEHCSEPLCVETDAGRKQYAQEQEKLAEAARPLRLQLLHAYDAVLSSLSQG